VPVETGPTIAEGTAIAKPVRLQEVIAALRRSGGSTVAVSEDAIAAGLWQLAQGLGSMSSRLSRCRRALGAAARGGRDRAGRDHGGGADRVGAKATPRVAALMGLQV